ncbi:MAG: HAMP domain-containing protein [Alphaproteobacteria bacterium]|nr:HAMP domain-containing protein [Alphaproteobacteria bacterium]MCB9698414.1 HAMP domain-containing protein [Alphaproteobacteria bacterium]
MRSIFVRTYATLASMVLVALIATWAWGLATRGPDPHFRDLALNGPLMVLESFASLPDDQAIARVEQGLDAEVIVRPSDEVALSELAQRRMAVGLPSVPSPGAEPTVLIRLADGRIAELRPHGPPPGRWPWLTALGLLVLGIGTAWQLRPLDRSLDQLARATERLASGDLTARVGMPATGPVGELAARFDAMAARLQRLVQGRTDLLLAVSHELRTPLQRIRLATELLADSRGEEEERRSLADALERDLDELDAMVGELLDLGKVELEAVQLEAVDLGEVLEECADHARRLGCEVQIALPDRRTAAADPKLLRRAVGNLVQNAVRYGNGHLRMSASWEAGEARIAVEDDGEGVPEDQRDRILEPFVRLEGARDRVRGGTGLGLAIVQRIVRQHGGEVYIGRSEALGGARFELRWSADAR